MTTQQPQAAPTLKWAHNAKNILAATDDGRLIRFFKTAKRTGRPPFQVITPPHDRYQIAVKGETNHAQWWICSAFRGKPPAPEARVIFKDGDRSNFSAHNLTWDTPIAPTLRNARTVELLRLAEGKKAQAIPGAPGYFTTPDGKLYRIQKAGPAKRVHGSRQSKSGCYSVQVQIRTPSRPQGLTIPLKEIIADMWLPSPRPTPYHRAELIDSRDPYNTHPLNLRWSATQYQRPWPHSHFTTSPAKAAEALRTEEDATEAVRQATLALWDKMDAQGARRLYDSFVWITPAGECLTLDAETAQPRYHQPDPITGIVKPLPHTSIHLPTAVADAFHSTPYAPNLKEPCPLSYRVITRDGGAYDCAPHNLIYRKSASPNLREVYKFA